VPAGAVSIIASGPGVLPRVVNLGPADTVIDFRLEPQGRLAPGGIVTLSTAAIRRGPGSSEPLLVVDGVVLSDAVVRCIDGRPIRTGTGAS
jgi:hypothetical protein